MTRFDPFAIPDETEASDDVVVVDTEELIAMRRISSIQAGRRTAGATGAVMAGAMLALRDIYEGPPKDILPIEIEASGEPHDVDRDGVDVVVGDVNVWAPPLPPRDPI
jgi:hypothetical protein